VIHVEGIGKRYRIGGGRRHDTLRDAIADRARRLVGRGGPKPAPAEFWALREVSFDVKEGEVVGIVGRNGAGKSTLLKIVSRITPPTQGRVRLNGRVASLLEVGTGFHPELTGRENIFLNGAILGMTRQEIRKKFDEIVAFSEVEKFLDTPVKHYSSGMYVRLAFAVAAHLEPEILIVDEVLAVGDTEFQKKCLGKMGEVAQGGRTVLFVSHNMAAVQQLAPRSVLLAEGHLERDGATVDVVGAYLGVGGGGASEAVNVRTETDAFRIRRVRFNREALEPGFNKPLRFDLDLKLGHGMKSVNFNLGIFNSIGARLLTARCLVDELPEGDSTLAVTVPDHRLPPGDYSLLLGISTGQHMLFRQENLLQFALSEVGLDEPLLVPFLAHHRDRFGAFVAAPYSVTRVT
jgi:lipopolysaccharide transport system ATP-binding protein